MDDRCGMDNSSAICLSPCARLPGNYSGCTSVACRCINNAVYVLIEVALDVGRIRYYYRAAHSRRKIHQRETYSLNKRAGASLADAARSLGVQTCSVGSQMMPDQPKPGRLGTR